MEALRTSVMVIQRKELQHVMPVMESALRLAALSLHIVKVCLGDAADACPVCHVCCSERGFWVWGIGCRSWG